MKFFFVIFICYATNINAQFYNLEDGLLFKTKEQLCNLYTCKSKITRKGEQITFKRIVKGYQISTICNMVYVTKRGKRKCLHVINVFPKNTIKLFITEYNKRYKKTKEKMSWKHGFIYYNLKTNKDKCFVSKTLDIKEMIKYLIEFGI